MILQCLIVDDEQLARDILEDYISRIKDLNVVAKCKNTSEAQAYLSKHSIDVLLLDIQMPQMTGVAFLRQLDNPPKVIFTTAYADYAIEGYELEVTDYLLKPIGFERFEKAIIKAREAINTEQKACTFEGNQTFETQFILIKEGYNHHKVFLKDIFYIAAMREYVQYHTKTGKLMELKSLSSIEKILPEMHFVRIHRSYIVAKSAVQGQEQNMLILPNELALPLGKTYKQRVLRELF